MDSINGILGDIHLFNAVDNAMYQFNFAAAMDRSGEDTISHHRIAVNDDERE
jgi:hypothetical protein